MLQCYVDYYWKEEEIIMKKNIDFNTIIHQIEATQQIPTEEPERQLYFMARCREIVAERSAQMGRPMTASVQTFQRHITISSVLSTSLAQPT